MSRFWIAVLAAYVFCLSSLLGGGLSRTKTFKAEADPMEELIKKMLLIEQSAPIPPIVKPVLAKGDHFVPLIRFVGIPVTKASVDRFTAMIGAANTAGAEAIVVELVTPGGSVEAGWEMARVIEMSKAPIHCVVDGVAASMGAYVLASCGDRLMTKRSRIMIHEPFMEGGVEGGVNQLLNIRNSLRATAEAMLEHEYVRTKLSKEEFRKHVENGQDWWLLWEEASKIGVVDGVVGSVESVVTGLVHGQRKLR